MSDILAIVGSFNFGEGREAREAYEQACAIIGRYLLDRRPDKVISGKCPRGGVDIWAIRIARSFGIETDDNTYAPTARRFNGPGGYRERDLRIAHDCTRLLAIRWRHSKTYGSGFTADHAEKLGKPVRRHIIPEGTS